MNNEYELRQEAEKRLDARIAQLEALEIREFARQNAAPKKQSHASNIVWPAIVSFGSIACLIAMTGIIASERPAALFPLWLFFGLPSLAALIVVWTSVLKENPPRWTENIVIRWLTGIFGIVALVLLIGAILMLIAKILS